MGKAPRPSFPGQTASGQTASVLKAQDQPAVGVLKNSRVCVWPPSRGVSKPDLQTTGVGVAHIPKPTSLGGHGGLLAMLLGPKVTWSGAASPQAEAEVGLGQQLLC